MYNLYSIHIYPILNLCSEKNIKKHIKTSKKSVLTRAYFILIYNTAIQLPKRIYLSLIPDRYLLICIYSTNIILVIVIHNY